MLATVDADERFRSASRRSRHPDRIRRGPPAACVRAAGRDRPAAARRPSHPGARRGDVASRLASGRGTSRGPSRACLRAGPSSRSRTACTRLTTPGSSSWWRTGASPSTARTRSCSPPAARTLRSGGLGRARRPDEQAAETGCVGRDRLLAALPRSKESSKASPTFADGPALLGERQGDRALRRGTTWSTSG